MLSLHIEMADRTHLPDNPVSFTPAAMEELNRLIATLDLGEARYLRIGVKGGGCAGMSYLLAFDIREEKDNRYQISNIPVVINKAQVMYVLGMQIDWENSDHNKGFVFLNPDAIPEPNETL